MVRKKERKLIPCACGCDRLILEVDKCRRPRRFVNGHNTKGSGNPRYNGGRTIDRDGYIMIYIPTHPFSTQVGYVREHRLVMEAHLGRYLTIDELVHHINGDKKDNRLENLQLMTVSEHISLHHRLRHS